MSHQGKIQKLIQRYNRRLQKLKEKSATQGVSADPSITIEIEDIEIELKKLNRELIKTQNEVISKDEIVGLMLCPFCGEPIQVNAKDCQYCSDPPKQKQQASISQSIQVGNSSGPINQAGGNITIKEEKDSVPIYQTQAKSPVIIFLKNLIKNLKK